MRGFTLIELMIVLAIVGAVITLGINRIDNRNTQMKAAVRKLSVLSKEIRTAARLQGATYRLVIDLGSKDSQGANTGQQFWVERSSKQMLIPKDRSTQTITERQVEDEENAPPPTWSKDERIMGGGKELPGSLEFEDVELADGSKYTNGIVYIHYFSQGLVEEAAIHLKSGEKMRWTLTIHPLTGKAYVANTYQSVREFSAE